MRHTVLIIDDDQMAMQYYEHALDKRGFAVTRSLTADDALSKIAGASYDVIVLDIMMSPGNSFTNEETDHGVRTGVELRKLIQQRSADSLVIALTNVINHEIVSEMEAIDETPVFSKGECPPFELVTQIQKLIESREQGQDSDRRAE